MENRSEPLNGKPHYSEAAADLSTAGTAGPGRPRQPPGARRGAEAALWAGLGQDRRSERRTLFVAVRAETFVLLRQTQGFGNGAAAGAQLGQRGHPLQEPGAVDLGVVRGRDRLDERADLLIPHRRTCPLNRTPTGRRRRTGR